MRIEGQALLARIHIGASDHCGGQPLYEAVVRLLRERGVAGATVLRGIEGFGRAARLHTRRTRRSSEDLPTLIEVVDEEDRRCAVRPELGDMVSEGLITLERGAVIACRSPYGEKPR